MRSDWKALGTFGTLGLEMVLSVMIGLFAGRWLDAKFATAPYLALTGFAFGVGAAVKAVLRALKQAQHQADNDGWKESQTDRPARFALDEKAKRWPEPKPRGDGAKRSRRSKPSELSEPSQRSQRSQPSKRNGSDSEGL